MSKAQDRRWISAVETAKRLDIDPATVRKLIRGGHLTVRTLPGCSPQILATDLDRLERQSITPATSSQAG